MLQPLESGGRDPLGTGSTGGSPGPGPLHEPSLLPPHPIPKCWTIGAKGALRNVHLI